MATTAKMNLSPDTAFGKMNGKPNKENDIFKDTILASNLFKISAAELKDSRLETNTIYKNLIGKLNAFYIIAEKYR